jgi:hypothetical protein
MSYQFVRCKRDPRPHDQAPLARCHPPLATAFGDQGPRRPWI